MAKETNKLATLCPLANCSQVFKLQIQIPSITNAIQTTQACPSSSSTVSSYTLGRHQYDKNGAESTVSIITLTVGCQYEHIHG